MDDPVASMNPYLARLPDGLDPVQDVDRPLADSDQHCMNIVLRCARPSAA